MLIKVKYIELNIIMNVMIHYNIHFFSINRAASKHKED